MILLIFQLKKAFNLSFILSSIAFKLFSLTAIMFLFAFIFFYWLNNKANIFKYKFIILSNFFYFFTQKDEFFINSPYILSSKSKKLRYCKILCQSTVCYTWNNQVSKLYFLVYFLFVIFSYNTCFLCVIFPEVISSKFNKIYFHIFY